MFKAPFLLIMMIFLQLMETQHLVLVQNKTSYSIAERYSYEINNEEMKQAVVDENLES